MGEEGQGMGEGENPDLVPGTNVSGEPRQRSNQEETGGWGRGGAGGAGVLQGRLGPGPGDWDSGHPVLGEWFGKREPGCWGLGAGQES